MHPTATYYQVPQDVPKAPHSLSHMVCPKFNSHWKVGLYKSLFVELICNWESKQVLLLGSTQYCKKIDDGPINIALSTKKKTVVTTPMNLIYLLLIFTSVWKELQEEDKLPYPKVGFMNK